jgi:hypothetical protein
VHSHDYPYDFSALFKDSDQSGPMVALTASSLAMKTAARIVVDVAHSFNSSLKKINMIALPPTYCYIIYRATKELISVCGSMDRVQWSRDLEILREACWNYSRRWQIAGMLTSAPVRHFALGD